MGLTVPFEVLLHAEMPYRSGKDLDRRLSLISFDNAIELAITTYLNLHPMQRGAENIRLTMWQSGPAIIIIKWGSSSMNANLKGSQQAQNMERYYGITKFETSSIMLVRHHTTAASSKWDTSSCRRSVLNSLRSRSGRHFIVAG